MPLRSASKGRQGSGDTSSSELKPNSTLPHSVSTPPTTAASTRPRRISRSAEAKTLALDEQAVEMVSAGPSRPSASCTNIASECGVWTSGPPLVGREAAVGVELRVGQLRSRRCSRWRCRAPARCAPGRSARAPPPPLPGSRRPAGRARPGGCCGNPSRPGRPAGGVSSRPSTRPIQVGSGAAPKSLARRPLLRLFERGDEGFLADADGRGRGEGADLKRRNAGRHGAGAWAMR